MPAALAIPLITAAASGTAAVIGSKLNSDASDRAGQRTADATAQATKLATEQEANRRREFDLQQSQLERQWNTDQANKAPYRALGQGALLKVSDLLGIPHGQATGAAPGRPGVDEEAEFRSIIGNTAPRTVNLLALAPQLKAKGYELVPNATLGPDGKPTNYDVRLPSGRIADVLVGGSRGGEAWQFNVGGGPSLPRTAMAAAMPASMAAKATQANYNPIIPFSQLMQGVR